MRIAVLLQVGKKAKNDLCLIDMKEAINPIAPADAKSSIPKNNAERVVQGAILFGFWTSRSHRPHCKLIPIRVARDLSAASTRDCNAVHVFDSTRLPLRASPYNVGNMSHDFRVLV
jgi:hypothetical protein